MPTSSAAAGYSGTPLVKKLGIKDGSRVLAIDAPGDYAELLAGLPVSVHFETTASASIDIAHVFATRHAELARHLRALRRELRTDAAIWVSWPKKTARVSTEVTEDVVREIALPLDLVDIKVCAVSPVWSGLKLVVRKELR